MKKLNYDALVCGAGAAGMSAALELASAGCRVALVDREEHLGGILPQCIHNGFGLELYEQELTGPEFAERLSTEILASSVELYLGCTVTELHIKELPKRARLISAAYGQLEIETKVLILAMGSRERNRGNVRIPGSRPAGVFTAGLAQRLLNIEGYLPGKEAVIIGSGDIGLIMARRLSWSGCHVQAVVEILPHPSGLQRNIRQCLDDFGIPLHLSSQTTAIFGRDRVEGVEVCPLEGGVLRTEKAFQIPCDTVLLSVGLVPENELSAMAGIQLDPTSGGPVVDSRLMCSVEGVFACGNVLHVHDLVDYVSMEAQQAGKNAVRWLNGDLPAEQIPLRCAANLRYVSPSKLSKGEENILHFRSLTVLNNAVLELRQGETLCKRFKLFRAQPAEMIRVKLTSEDTEHLRSDEALDCLLLPKDAL